MALDMTVQRENKSSFPEKKKCYYIITKAEREKKNYSSSPSINQAPFFLSCLSTWQWFLCGFIQMESCVFLFIMVCCYKWSTLYLWIHSWRGGRGMNKPWLHSFCPRDSALCPAPFKHWCINLYFLFGYILKQQTNNAQTSEEIMSVVTMP